MNLHYVAVCQILGVQAVSGRLSFLFSFSTQPSRTTFLIFSAARYRCRQFSCAPKQKHGLYFPNGWVNKTFGGSLTITMSS